MSIRPGSVGRLDDRALEDEDVHLALALGAIPEDLLGLAAQLETGEGMPDHLPKSTIRSTTLGSVGVEERHGVATARTPGTTGTEAMAELLSELRHRTRSRHQGRTATARPQPRLGISRHISRIVSDRSFEITPGRCSERIPISNAAENMTDGFGFRSFGPLCRRLTSTLTPRGAR